MTPPIKVVLTSAFTDLCHEIGISGAMFFSEAALRFGAKFVDAALDRKVCIRDDTEYGAILCLSPKGRKLISLTGTLHPSTQGFEDALCLRDARADLIGEGHTVELVARKRRTALVYMKGEVRVLALAQARGYNNTVLRRIYHGEIQSGPHDELHLYAYLTIEEMTQLGLSLLNPRNPATPPIPPEKLFVYALAPWPSKARATKQSSRTHNNP